MEQKTRDKGRHGGSPEWLGAEQSGLPVAVEAVSMAEPNSMTEAGVTGNLELESYPVTLLKDRISPSGPKEGLPGNSEPEVQPVTARAAQTLPAEHGSRLDAILPAGAGWEKEWRRSAEAQYDQHMADISRELDQDILIALVGDVNAGKSSTLNRIVGEEVAGVGAEPGETTEVRPYLFKDRIFFVDTPGLNDVRLENSQTTMDYYRKADIILFFLNAAGTVYSEAEKRSFEAIRDANPNLLIVLNKIDAADDIPRLAERVRKETGERFRVIPVSSRTGENIEVLRAAILELLQKKSKDLLFARNMKEKSAAANKWILGAAASASAIGAAPIPGADIVPISAVQIGLLTRLAVLYGRPISKETAKELVIATVIGNLGKSVFRQVIKLFPGAGSIAGASVAGAMTLALGYAVKYAYENDMEINQATLGKLYGMFRKQAEASH
ncbi:50S ribosome-binding GTPase [Paenibacillus pasadenensis]|uniref:GTPase n=1 Tax=Paenibacillus pasadenensis TaxID=217090 RepID=UPI00203BFE23|nr:50S ribosome-binding GTPase [Paenibacillus pasadenensis]